MTTQEVYEAIHAFFSKDGAQLAKTTTDYCFYRGGRDAASPLRCAVGCILPDETYRPEMEGRSLGYLFGAGCNEPIFPEAHAFFSKFDNRALDFLRAAQSAHDDRHTTSVDLFLCQLGCLAKHYRLRVTA